jgi:hypothetical protein
MSEVQIENWRPIPGYEGVYEVSDLGRVRFLGRQISVQGRFTRTYPPKVLSPSPAGKGYLQVSLFSDGAQRWFKVAKLVCLAFHGPKPSPKHETRHVDGVRTNNRANNLCWATKSSNALDKVFHGTWRGRKRLTAEEIWEIRSRLAAGDSLTQIGRDLGVSKGSVFNIREGITYKEV